MVGLTSTVIKTLRMKKEKRILSKVLYNFLYLSHYKVLWSQSTSRRRNLSERRAKKHHTTKGDRREESEGLTKKTDIPMECAASLKNLDDKQIEHDSSKDYEVCNNFEGLAD
ncbi:unnamed protein product [Caretta caretta]